MYVQYVAMFMTLRPPQGGNLKDFLLKETALCLEYSFFNGFNSDSIDKSGHPFPFFSVVFIIL